MIEITEKKRVVERLQRICADVFLRVSSHLQVGQSEFEIAEAFDKAFKEHGIVKHWYDVPFNVLIGAERFIEGTMTTDYSIKAPVKNIRLQSGEICYADFAPMDTKTGIWGDWSATIVFHPRHGLDNEQVAFLQEMRSIQRGIIERISAETTGRQVIELLQAVYERQDITIADVRKNVGHSMHAGLKKDAKRVWLDEENTTPLGEGIFTFEPGVYKKSADGQRTLVARFEDCMYIPKKGFAEILGRKEPVPFVV